LDQTMKIFLSYSFAHQAQADALSAALRQLDGISEVFLSSDTLRGGQRWLEELQEKIRSAEAFVFLLGDYIGNWQRVEFADAFDRKVAEDPKRISEGRGPLPLVPLIFQADAPSTLLRRDEKGLPFVQRLHLVIDTEAFGSRDTKLYANPTTVQAIQRGLVGTDAEEKTELWRSLNPYRGLLALREQDADFLFGRDDDIRRFVFAMAEHPMHLLLALGASGVGKSSLIFAGVFAALERQHMKGGWPSNLRDSRLWPRLTLTPGIEPVRSLVNAFVRQW